MGADLTEVVTTNGGPNINFNSFDPLIDDSALVSASAATDFGFSKKDANTLNLGSKVTAINFGIMTTGNINA
ncbi:MAG: hypothetical protein QF535_06345, partial [Anaerolineales bacterium]|nr:hypothetical protein [Anaerolineales bacterium]